MSARPWLAGLLGPNPQTKSGTRKTQQRVKMLRGQMEQLEARQMLALAAGNLSVVQLTTGTTAADMTVTVSENTADFAYTTSGSSRGDYAVQIGADFADDIAGGVLMTTVRENGRVNPIVDAVTRYTVSSLSRNGGGWRVSTTSGEVTAETEVNVNTAAVYFPVADFPNQGVFDAVTTDPGTNAQVTFPGVTPNDGILLANWENTGTASADDRFALVNPVATGWQLFAHDSNTASGAFTTGPVRYVYVPYTTPTSTAIVGRAVLGTPNTAVSIVSNQVNHGVSIVRTGTGTYTLSIAGQTPTSGVLVLANESTFTNGNKDNFVSYQASGSSWTVQVRDITPDAAAALQDDDANSGVFSFIFVPVAPPVQPTSAILDVDGSGKLIYTAGENKANAVTVSDNGANLVINDTGETITVTAAAQALGFTGTGTNTVSAPLLGLGSLTAVEAKLTGGNDSININTTAITVPITLNGGGDAGDTLVLNQNITTTGAVSLTGFGGSITQAAGRNLTAGALTLSGGAVGSAATPIHTTATSIVATGGNGGVFVTETDGANVGATATGSGNVQFINLAGALTVFSPTTTVTGNVSLTSPNEVNVNAVVNAGSGTITIAANTDGAGAEGYTQAAGGNLITTNNTAGALTLVVNTAAGGTGNATIGLGNVAGDYNVTTNAGSILWQTALGAYTVPVGTASGGNYANNLQALNYRLNTSASTASSIGTVTAPLQLGTPDGNRAAYINAGSGGIFVADNLGGNLNFAQVMAAGAGDILLVTNDASSHALRITGPVTTGSGNIRLMSDDNLDMETGAIIGGAGFSGTVRIQANLDQGTGQFFNMTGNAAIVTSNATANAVLIEQTSNANVAPPAIALLQNITVGNGGTITVNASPVVARTGGISMGAGKSLNAGPNGTVVLIARDHTIGATGAPIVVTAGNVTATTTSSATVAGSIFVQSTIAASMQATTNTNGTFAGEINLSTTAGNLTIGGATNADSGAINLTSTAGVIITGVLGDANTTGNINITAAAGSPVTFNTSPNVQSYQLHIAGGNLTEGIAGPLLAPNLKLDAAAAYDVAITGAGADQHTQSNVAGTVDITGATLNVSVAGYTSTGANSFVIIANDGNEPIVGTFASRAQGSAIVVGTSTFYINYFGGDGNDIALQETAPPVNLPPSVFPDTYTLDLSVATTLIVPTTGPLTNDFDPEGVTPLAMQLVTTTQDGALTVSNDGSFTFTPPASTTGVYTFTYRASDGVSLSVPQTVTINVINRPVPPIAVDDTTSTTGAAVVVNVLTNDSDPNGGTPTVTAVGTAANGTVAFDATTVTYTPNGGFFGTDSFTYTITDSTGKTASAKVTATVTGGTGTNTVTFQQGTNGYAGAVDTFLQSTAADTNNGTAQNASVDNDNPFAHSLLRFDNIFGSGAGQIPVGSNITSATLTVVVFNEGPGNTLRFHRMAMPWTDATTWNTAGAAPFNATAGLQADGVEALAAFDASGEAATQNTFNFDISTSLRAWIANPSTNFGWAVLPTGNDGAQWRSSDYTTNTAQRPLLSVTFTPPPNLAPVNSLKNEVLVDEDIAFPFTGTNAISVSDPDAGTASVRTTVSLPAASGTLGITPVAGATVTGAGTNNVQITGPIADVNLTLASLIYNPPLNFNGSVVMTVATTDQGNTGPGGPQSDSDTVLLTIRSINDAPTFNAITNPPSITGVSGAQTVPAFATGASAGPADEVAQTLTYVVTQTAATNGLTFTAPPTIAADGTLTYTATPGTSGTATFSVVLQDNGSRLAPHDNESVAQSFTITVIGDNQPPVNTAPATASVNEDSSLTFTGPNLISIADPDAGAAPISTTLTIPAGTGVLNVVTAAGATVTGSGSVSVQITGPTAAVNATLASLVFVPTAQSNGPVSLSIATTDQGNTGDGGPKTDSDTVAITVVAINDAPTFALGANPSTTQSSGPQTVTGFATSILAGPPNESLQTLQFIITPTGSTGGLTFSAAPSIDATGNLTYTATAGAFGTATFSVVLQDNGSGVAPNVNTSAAQSFTITVIQQNQPPINSLQTTASVNEDGSLAFTGPNLISISDPDAGGASVRTTITLQTPNSGSIALSASGGAVVTGSSPSFVINGTIAAINATLASLTYSPAANFFGPISLQVLTDDLGNVGPGGAKTDTDVINITVNSVNDPPSFAGLAGDPPTVTLNAGLQSVANFASGMSAGPANESGQTLSFVLTQTGSTDGLTFAVAPSINPTTGELRYQANAGSHGTATFSVVLNDGLANSSPARTFIITVLSVAYTPVVDGPDTAVRGAPTNFHLSTITNPADAGNPILYEIDWDGNGSVDESILGDVDGVDVTHTFLIEGQQSFFVTATDQVAGYSASVEHVIDVTVVGLVFNEDTGSFDAVVGGTIFADRIALSLHFTGAIQARINNKNYIIPDADGKIIVYGLDGGDTISVAANVPYDTALYGGTGNDYLAGGIYNDYLDGGDGADRLLGSNGDNSYDGGAGNDTLTGRNGNEYMLGGAGNDNIFGSGGDDVIDGGIGNDTLNGSTGDDIVRGGAGTDIIRGEAGHDILIGNDGNDTLYGSNGRDILIGGGQADQLRGGYDDDILIGGKSLWEENDPSFDDELRGALLIWLLPQTISSRVGTLYLDYFNESTVDNDLNARDTLYGEQDSDWFLVNAPDVVNGKTALDIRTDLT